MTNLDTDASAEISKPSDDTAPAVTETNSEKTEDQQNPDSSGDTTPEPAAREVKREVTKSEEEEHNDKEDPAVADAKRRSYEVTRREIELGFKEGGANYILELDESTMDAQRKSEINAAIKYFWGQEATNLEDAKKFIRESQKSQKKSDEVEDTNDSQTNIDDLVAQKVEEALKQKESETTRVNREKEEDEQLKDFIDKNEFLKPENDPEDKNWKKFDEVLTKINKLGDDFSFEEKLSMSLNKAFGGEHSESPSSGTGNMPSIGIGSAPKLQEGLGNSKFLDYIPKETRANLAAAGKI